MIRKNRPQSSSLFLMELILAILFFSIASAVCVQFFVKSHLLSRHSQELSQAVNECSAIAEICKTSDGLSQVVELLNQEYPQADIPSSSSDSQPVTLTIYFDKDFVPCSEADDTSYVLHLTLQESDQMLTTEMQVVHSQDESIIYELSTKHHIARRISHE